MTSCEVNGYTAEKIDSILNSAQMLLRTTSPQNIATLVGTVLSNSPKEDTFAIAAAMNRASIRTINASPLIDYSLSSSELINQIRIAENAVDILITSFHSNEGLGTGRRFAKRVAGSIEKPMIHYSDEIYSSQGALSEMLGIIKELKSVEGKKVAISWGFGNQFISSNIAHSLQLFLACKGIDYKVVAPPEFQTLNRVKRDAAKLADEEGSSCEYLTEFQGACEDADIVIAMNWASLDAFQKPEKNIDIAAEYRNWYFKREILPDSCKMLFQPPIQIDLVANESVVIANREGVQSWLSRRMAVLISTLLQCKEGNRFL